MIDCYFTDSIHLAFRLILSKGKNKLLEYTNAYQFHGCLGIFSAKNRFKNYLETCSKMPGVIYKFENQNLVSFEDDFQYLGNLPFVAQFHFGTTIGSSLRNYLDDVEMYLILCCLFFFAFHSKLDIEQIVIVKSFQHTLDELNDISYFKSEMIDEVDPIIANQSRDCP